MTRDEILNMHAGRTMDALILASVFGVMAFRDGVDGDPYKLGAWQEREPVPNYSGDILAAWAIVEKIEEDCDIDIKTTSRGWLVTMERNRIEYCANDESAPLAVCKAALLAKVAIEKDPPMTLTDMPRPWSTDDMIKEAKND